jgi:hypothetical protein
MTNDNEEKQEEAPPTFGVEVSEEVTTEEKNGQP